MMMLAVCSHKVITAFSLGLSFFQAGWWDCTSISVMVTFTVAGPIGTVIGFIVASGDGTEVLSAIFMSITSGTFLYIAMTEVVALEFSKVENKILKFVGFFLGVAAFACLALVREPDGG